MSGFNIVGVQFARASKIFSFSYDNLDLVKGDAVVVETERGLSIGYVVSLKFAPNLSEEEKKRFKPVLRKATAKELTNPPIPSVEDVTKFTQEKIDKFRLNMRVLKSEVQFGGNKIIIYFNSPGRVDFRDLVKELASGLKARVELKQVGARDETKLLGGVGICGREYCCSSFLREFVPVSIRMAKNQNLALNPSKISGGCGRLLCCLTYENDVYTELRQNLPPRGVMVQLLETGEEALVLKSDILNQTLFVEFLNGKQQTVSVSEISLDVDNPRVLIQQNKETWGDDLDINVLNEHL